MEVNGLQNCLVTNILQNIIFCVLQKKVSLSYGLEWVRNDNFHVSVTPLFRKHHNPKM